MRLRSTAALLVLALVATASTPLPARAEPPAHVAPAPTVAVRAHTLDVPAFVVLTVSRCDHAVASLTRVDSVAIDATMRLLVSADSTLATALPARTASVGRQRRSCQERAVVSILPVTADSTPLHSSRVASQRYRPPNRTDSLSTRS